MLTPARFSDASVRELLEAAAAHKVGIDRRWADALLSRAPNETVAEMVRFARENHELDEELVAILGRLQTPEALPFLLDYIRRNPLDLTDNLAAAIYPFRHEALEPLLELCGELDEEELSDIAFLLAAFRVRDERVLKMLLDRLEYDAGDGALCLGLYGDPAARPALEAMLGEVDDDHLRQDIKGAIAELDRPVVEEPPDPTDLNEIFPERDYPDTSSLDTSELLEMLACEDAELRFAGAAGLINRDFEDGEADALFEHAESDEDPKVRAKCWEALSDEMEENDKIRAAMTARLEDESAPLLERQGALVGLGRRSGEPPVRKYAEEFYRIPEARAAALAAMWTSMDRSFRPFFPPHLDDADPDVRKQAISGVGYLGIHGSAEKLREMFDDEEFRPNALFAYALCVRGDVSSPARVRTLLSKIEAAAGGFSEEEKELVQLALDQRLILQNDKPVFHPEPDDEPEPEPPTAPVTKVGRNDPCPCGSGKKYKKCHGA
jgi:HEAT repeat protein